MSPEQMRVEIKKAYNSERWRTRVDNMWDNQVMAIYFNMLKKEEVENRKKEVDERQLTFDDILKFEGRIK